MHYLIKSRQVFWLKFPNNAPGFFQMFSRQSVLIMRRHRLNIIFTSFGKNDICCFQKTTNFFMPNNLIESVLVKETIFFASQNADDNVQALYTLHYNFAKANTKRSIQSNLRSSKKYCCQYRLFESPN